MTPSRPVNRTSRKRQSACNHDLSLLYPPSYLEITKKTAKQRSTSIITYSKKTTTDTGLLSCNLAIE